MSQDPLELVAFSGDTAYGATYQVNMQRIVDIVKLKEMEGVVKERFGIPALRIFRLLFQRHQLEQKQVSAPRVLQCLLPFRRALRQSRPTATGAE